MHPWSPTLSVAEAGFESGLLNHNISYLGNGSSMWVHLENEPTRVALMIKIIYIQSTYDST